MTTAAAPVRRATAAANMAAAAVVEVAAAAVAGTRRRTCRQMGACCQKAQWPALCHALARRGMSRRWHGCGRLAAWCMVRWASPAGLRHQVLFQLWWHCMVRVVHRHLQSTCHACPIFCRRRAACRWHTCRWQRCDQVVVVRLRLAAAARRRPAACSGTHPTARRQRMVSLARGMPPCCMLAAAAEAAPVDWHFHLARLERRGQTCLVYVSRRAARASISAPLHTTPRLPPCDAYCTATLCRRLVPPPRGGQPRHRRQPRRRPAAALRPSRLGWATPPCALRCWHWRRLALAMIPPRQ